MASLFFFFSVIWGSHVLQFFVDTFWSKVFERPVHLNNVAYLWNNLQYRSEKEKFMNVSTLIFFIKML